MLIAGQAGAKTMEWKGTLDLELWGGSASSVAFEGSGVATVNGTAGGAHLSTLRIADGVAGSAVIPITDPNVTPSVKSIRLITAGLGSGTWTGISGAPPLGQPELPVPGHARVCLFVDGCTSNLPLNLTKNNGNTGVGVAGTVTLGGFGEIRISLAGAPWTLGTVSGINQTLDGGFITLSRGGFAHGAGSTNSSTAVTSGVVQLIAPTRVTTEGLAGNTSRVALFSTLTLHFIPEPGLLLLLASGVVGLGLLGRGRMKR
jgi:hypothetical protein